MSIFHPIPSSKTLIKSSNLHANLGIMCYEQDTFIAAQRYSLDNTAVRTGKKQ